MFAAYRESRPTRRLRRSFVRQAGIVPIMLAISLGATAREPRPPARPNIVLIMADDLGFSDLGCYGSEISTPNLDRLAAGGLRFTQFYNAARCCPSRAALLTGLYPHQAGVGHMAGNRGLPPYQGFLNDRCVTLAEALRQGGYHVMMSGKWHVGEQRPHWPLDRGFERYFGLISGACNYFRLAPGRQMAVDNDPYVPRGDGFYMTDAITDHAVSFIDEYGRGVAPFFLYVSYTAPHFPLHAPPEDVARYRGRYMIGWDTLRQQRHQRLLELEIVDPGWLLSQRDPDVKAWEDIEDKASWDLKMAVYAAQIDRMDQGIGRILARLRTLGVEQDTLVMFLSDNGGGAADIDAGRPGAACGHPDSYMAYGRPWANASNTPFRLFKRWVHEGGIATPFIAHWPAVIKPGGGVTREVGHIIDVMATCLDVAGTEYPETFKGHRIVPIEGRSLLPVLQGKDRSGHDYLFWEHEGHRAVRHGKWKLLARHHEPWELYDLDTDRTELHDVAKKHKELVQELAAEYDSWAHRCSVVPFDELPRKDNVVPWYRLPPSERPESP